MAKLTIETGSERGKQFKLPESGTFEIGRDEKCAVRIEDIMASRVHCVVSCDSGKWVIEDHKSTNGFMVNDVPVDRHTLIPGDTIAIGDTLLSLSATDDDPLIDSTLAGYHIEKRLGRGAMGTVYLARQLSLDRPVALKILAPRFSKDEDFIQRFLEEARAAGRLNHPNVVQVYDAGHEGDHHYMSMEFLEGGSLEELLDREVEGRLEVFRAVEVARDAAQALQFAQQNHIVHRDIKPGNLLLTLEGTVKVGDLGIAADLRQYSGGANAGANAGGKTPVVGSPRYMAPEQAKGESLDQRADIYALGATLYKMIAGVAPFEGSSVKEIITRKLNSDPLPLRRIIPEVPGGLSAVVQKMLARNPDSRYEYAEQVYTALDPTQYRKSISSKGKARVSRAAATTQGVRPAAGRARPLRSSQKSQSNLVVGSVLGVIALVFALVLVTKMMNNDSNGRRVSRPGDSNPEVSRPVTGPEKSGIERDPSEVALKERKRIASSFSKGTIDAEAALQRLENLLASNPRIAPSSEKLLKKLRNEVEVEKKEAAKNLQKNAKAAVAAIDVLIEKRELQKAADSIAAFLKRYSDFGLDRVSSQRQKLSSIVRVALDEAQKRVSQLVSSGDFEKARAEIATLRATMPSSESARLQAMAAKVSLAENRMADSLKFVQDKRGGIYELLADFDFSGSKKQLDDIIGKLGGAEKATKEAKALLGLLGRQVSSSKLVWGELQSIFSESVKSKSVLKVRFLPRAKDGKDPRYKVLGLEEHAVRVHESGAKAPPPVAYRTLGLDTGSMVSMVAKRGRSGLGEAEIFQGLGMLLLLREGPARARPLLLSEKISAEAKKDNEALLSRYVDSWREARLYSLQRLENKLGTAKSPVPVDMWNFIATDAGVLITDWKKRPDYSKVRATLHELFLRTRIAALAGASVDGAFNAKTVKESRDGLTTLQYDFSTVDQLKDFYPVSKGGSSIEWVEKKRLLKLKGEVRFLAANPFDSRLAITGVVPAGGYNPQSPNINVALWTEEDDIVTYGLDGRTFNYNAWREGDGGAEPPADFFVLGMGYKTEVSVLSGTLGGGRLGALARTLTNWLPVYLKESSLALLSGDHGSTLHRRRAEKIWDQSIGSLFRSGTVRFAISMDGSELKWKVNNKTINYKTGLAHARLGDKVPHLGSFSLFTNNSTVYYSSFEIVGKISKEWASGLAKSLAERELKKLDPSFARSSGGSDENTKPTSGAGTGSGKGTEPKPKSEPDKKTASSAGAEELKGLVGQFDKNGDGTLDKDEQKSLQDFLLRRRQQAPASSPKGNQPAGSAGTPPGGAGEGKST